MDLTRLAVDAGQFINRAIQYTGESLGQADRTELDPGVEELLSRVESTKTCTDKIISQTEVLLQPNPGARLEDRLYEHLEWSVQPRPRALEVLGNEMTQAGLEMGSNTPYGAALVRCGEVQKNLGETERQFVQSTNIHFLTPLRSFTEGEYRAIQEERKMLLNKRLDLDIAKTRLNKAHEAEREDRNLNANPLDEASRSHVSYMFSFLRVRWLKIWAQEISQAEMELRISQSLFDRQSEIARRALEGISITHTNHMRSLSDFVEAQAVYFDQCNQHAQELRKQLASVPAVLCSNNWQSERRNPPCTSGPLVNEPNGVNPVPPLPILVLPDFDQDSWIANPPTGPRKTTTDSSVTSQPPDQTKNNNNNNNNNNNVHTSNIRSHSALRDGCATNPDNRTPDPLSAPDRTVDTHVTSRTTTAECAAASQSEKPSAAAASSDGAGNGMTSSSSPPSQLSVTGNESHTEANADSDGTTATAAYPNGEDVVASAGRDVVQ